MDRKTELDLIDELLALKQDNTPFLDEKATQNPVTHYTSESRFEVETKSIFAALPNCAAHASELANPGEFVRREIAGRSVLLTCDKDGQVRAFLNVCRHRGTRLVDDEAGCKHRFSCPYHAWTYANSGELIAAPHFDSGFPEADKTQFGLTQLPCTVRFGLVWVIADPAQNVDIDTYFTEMADELEALGMADMVIACEDVKPLNANWKILVEGGIEAYHFKVAHRDTIGPYFEDNLSSYRCVGQHMRSVLPRTSMAKLTPETRDSWRLRDHANVLYTLFPTTQMLVQQDHIVLITSQPVATDKSVLRLSTLVPKDRVEETAYWQRNHAITMTTLDEDFAIGESIQNSLGTGANTHMTFGRFEGALTKFNEMVEARLD